MSVFEQTLAYNNMTSSFLSKVFKRKLKKVSAIQEALQEQVELSDDMLGALMKQAAPKTPQSKTALAGLKREIKKYIKAVKAIYNGIETETLPYPDFRVAVKNSLHPILTSLSHHAASFIPDDLDQQSITDEVNKVARDKGMIAALDQLKRSNKRIKEKEDSLEKEKSERIESIDDAKARKEIRDLARNTSKLPTSLRGRKFSLIYMPIVPYMGSNYKLTSPTFLNKVGIDFTVLAKSFVVFNKQALLVFDFGEAIDLAPEKPNRSETKEKKFKKGLSARKSSARHQAQQEQFVLSIIDSINEASSEPYVLVSSTFPRNPKNNRIGFAWIMPKHQYNVFERNATSGELTNVDWDFPWTKEAMSIL